MSDYRMDIRGSIGLSDYSNIYDYIGVVDNKDNFTITVDNCGNESIQVICKMLSDSDFYIKDQGYDNQGRYYINAYKNK